MKDELAEVKKEELKIVKEEKKIREEEKEIKQEIRGSGFQDLFVSRLRKHRFINTLLVTIGVVLVWRGLWDVSERLIESSVVSLVLGLVLLWGIKKFSDLH